MCAHLAHQVIVERWRRGTPAQFWVEFSHDNGTHLSFTAICKCLRAQRHAEDEVLSEKARLEFGADFDIVFSYCQGGRCVVMSDITTIANKYREQKALKNNVD